LDFAILEDKNPCQQNFWNDDGDPLFDTSSIESDHNFQSYEDLSIVDLDFHNDKDEVMLDDKDKILSIKVSSEESIALKPCVFEIQECDQQK
jgi:hypothetical protein